MNRSDVNPQATRLLLAGVTLALLAGGATGCAFGDCRVVLAYPPPVQQPVPPAPPDFDSEPPQKLAPAPAPVLRTPLPSNGITVVLVPFADERPKQPIGEVRNGFGMHTADVLAENNVAKWAADAVAHELKFAGYRVRRAKGAAVDPGTAVVSGNIVTVYCRAMLQYEAEVALMGQVTVGGQTVVTKVFAGKGGSGMNWAATSAGYGESLSLAMQDAAQKFVAQIRTVPLQPPPPPAAPPVPSPPTDPAPPLRPTPAPSTPPALPTS